jgi:hypothetical protein
VCALRYSDEAKLPLGAATKVPRVFGLGETLAITLVGLATRIAAKMTAYT